MALQLSTQIGDSSPVRPTSGAATAAELRTSIHRLTVLSLSSLPLVGLVAIILWPYVEADRMQLWLLAAVGLSAASTVVAGAAWRRLPLMLPSGLRQFMWLAFGIPMALQWGSLGLVVAPEGEHAGLVLGMLVLVAAAAVLGAAGAPCPYSTLSFLAGILVPNYVWFAWQFGALSVPSMLLVYGSLLTLALGALAFRELRAREVLIERSEQLLAAVTIEQTNLSVLNDELEYRATHDQLMGIPNRELLQRELAAALASPAEGTDRARVGLLFMDLDRFKFVNDTLGHAAGDALLKAVGRRVQSAIADEDALVARVGGDELVVLMRELSSNDHLGLVADKLLAKFVDPFTIEGVELSIGTSVGMAESLVGESADELYRHADAALYEAKQRGRGQAVFADQILRNKRNSRIRTELALRTALNEHGVEAWYQPEVDLLSGEVIAGEALARWRLGDDVALASSFIHVAERAGLLEQLMFEMVDQVWAWRRRTGSQMPISVNVSTSHLPALLACHEADPSRRPLVGLRLEISETDIIRDFNGTRLVLEKIRALGGQIILDDFGAETSSLRMLSDLPIDGLKIDRSYVARLQNDERVRQLVTSITEFGRSCGLLVIAEGVETSEQARFLLAIGIDRAQGMLFSPAVETLHFDAMAGQGYTNAAALAGHF